MNSNWKSYPSAPAEGATVCAASEVPAHGTHSVELDGFPILLARSEGTLVAYVNACPHAFLPLDYRSDAILSADGRILRCSNHQAGFDLATGQGTDGLGLGCSLDPIPIYENTASMIVIDNY
ncbi:Rieske (2Fe-2S) protein [Roseivivax marinus]|uniref:Rieske (2Fe-2S) protein n=1 Tax=Roseivivax marinus TaxID=1379903 RepID=UPI00273D25BE|nr:Rieske (2Fe-2S) protein [Roseivivax marinus]